MVNHSTILRRKRQIHPVRKLVTNRTIYLAVTAVIEPSWIFPRNPSGREHRYVSNRNSIFHVYYYISLLFSFFLFFFFFLWNDRVWASHCPPFRKEVVFRVIPRESLKTCRRHFRDEPAYNRPWRDLLIGSATVINEGAVKRVNSARWWVLHGPPIEFTRPRAHRSERVSRDKGIRNTVPEKKKSPALTEDRSLLYRIFPNIRGWPRFIICPRSLHG